MSIRVGRGASRELTRNRLEQSRGRTGRGWFVMAMLAASLVSLGLAGGYLYARQAEGTAVATPAAADTGQTPVLQQKLEQSLLALKVSEARGHELERQIDALNQRLREYQDELTFFRKAGERKH